MKDGKISEELSNILREVITIEDHRKIAYNLGYSVSTVNNIVYRNSPVNQRNKVIVQALTSLAVERISYRLEQDKEYQKKIKKYKKHYE